MRDAPAVWHERENIASFAATEGDGKGGIQSIKDLKALILFINMNLIGAGEGTRTPTPRGART
jgi:hypothetical protein